jgi:hypothetical protein
MYRHLLLAVPFVIATFTTDPSAAQSRHERKAKELEESAQPKALAGGVNFHTPLSIDQCFETVLNHLKRQGHDVEIADKDAGRIVTAMKIAGRHSQTGTRILVILIKDTDTKTSVRVAVSAQKRKKLLMTEPWSDPKLDEAESATVARQLQEALKAL